MRILGCLAALAALACSTAFAESVPVDDPRWELAGAEAEVVEFQGTQSLHLRGAIANWAGANFDTGVIEFDMALPSNAQSFPGVYFRGQDDFNYEHFYLRPHQNGNPDAMQYTPVINGSTGWQIYPHYNAQTRLPINQWFHVRMEIAADSARIFVNSDQPTLLVGDLKRERAPGYVMLRGSLGGAYYANINITPGEPAAAPTEALPEPRPGLVRTWRVSPPMAPHAAFAAASANRLGGVTWRSLPAETNGVANLARVAERTDEANTVLARLTVRADRSRLAPMRFGFSDRVRVYLNGAPLYEGADLQASRDYRFLGIVGWYDTLYLPLRRGENEIVFAVSEGDGSPGGGGGGWAAAAAFPDMAGLTVTGE